MRSIIAFLMPTRLKLLFLVEWALYVLFALGRGELRGDHSLRVAAYPFAFYYLVGCTLVALSGRAAPIVGGGRLLAWGLAPALLDQGAKLLVGAFVPEGASIPIVPGWLDLDHARNPLGSWLLSLYRVRAGWVVGLLQWSTTLFVLALSLVGHRYYAATHRRSPWADVAFIGLFSAMVSWVCDMALRGYTLDYIGLPGHFSADLKDIVLGIGATAVFAEGLDNPRLDRRWPGWRGECERTMGLIGDVARFAVRDLRGLVRGRAARGAGDPGAE